MKHSRDNTSSGWADNMGPPPFKQAKSSFTVRLAQDTAISYHKKGKAEQPSFFTHTDNSIGTSGSSPEYNTTEQGVNSLINIFCSEYAFLSKLSTDNGTNSANIEAARLGTQTVSSGTTASNKGYSDRASRGIYSPTSSSSSSSSSPQPSFQWLSEPKKVIPPIQNVRGVIPEIGCYWAQEGAELVLSSCANGTRDGDSTLSLAARASAVPAIKVKLQFNTEITHLVCGRPIHRVFKKEYEWVLVAVTKDVVNILLYSPTRNLIDDTGFSVPIPCVTTTQPGAANATTVPIVITAAAITPDGRPFLGGSDGHIYELRYRKQPCVAQLRRVTGGLLSDLGRGLLRLPADPVAQLAVDGARGLLYCLRGKSSDIEAYRVGSSHNNSNNKEFKLVAAARQLYKKVCCSIGKYLFSKNVTPSQEVLEELSNDETTSERELWSNTCGKYFPRFVVSIQPLALKTIGLVAVTAQGVLLYFAPPVTKTLELVDTELNGDPERLVSVSAAAYSSGAILTALTRVPTRSQPAGPAAAISCSSSVVPGSSFFSTLSLVPQPPDASSAVRAIIPMGSGQLLSPDPSPTSFTLAMPGPPPPSTVAAVLSFRRGLEDADGDAAGSKSTPMRWLEKLIGWWKGEREAQGGKVPFPGREERWGAEQRAKTEKEFYAGFGLDIRTPGYAQYASCDAISQLFVPPQTFLVEYASADADAVQYYTLTKRRALEVFRSVILSVAESHTSEDSLRFQSFIRAFAPEEVYIMSIALYAAFSRDSGAGQQQSSSFFDVDDEASNNAIVANYAKKIFLGEARIDRFMKSRSTVAGGARGSSMFRSAQTRDDEGAFKMYRFVGVCTFLSRVLQPLLASALCDPRDPGALAWDPADLRQTLGYLHRVHELLSQAPAGLYPSDKYASCIPQVLCVLERAHDALAFLGVLAENNTFARTVSLLDSGLQRELPAAQLYDLVRGNPGENTLLLTLIAAAMEALGEGSGADSLRGVLAKECPAFFPHAELARFRGVQLLSQAQRYTDAAQVRALLRDSLAEFLKVPGLGIDAICHAYTAKGFYEGVVRLALQAAEDVDRAASAAAPSILRAGAGLQMGAAGRRRGGVPQHDDSKRIENYKARCYQHVLKLFGALRRGISPAGLNRMKLGARDTAVDPAEVRRLVALALSYKSKGWHMKLYEWYIANDLQNELLDIDSPYILEFLEKCAKGPSLVWRYHARHGHPEEAARALYSSAMDKDTLMPVAQRIELLATAAGMLKVPALVNSALERSVRRDLETLVYQRHILAELARRGAKGLRSAQEVETRPLTMKELTELAEGNGLFALVIEGMRIRGDRNDSAIRGLYVRLIRSWRDAGAGGADEAASVLGDLARQALSGSSSNNNKSSGGGLYSYSSSSSSPFSFFNTFFPTDLIMRELVALGEARPNMQAVLRALIEAGVPQMLLFVTLRDIYNERRSSRNISYNFYGDSDSKDNGEAGGNEEEEDEGVVELRESAIFVVEELVHALCNGSDTRCTGSDMQQVREFVVGVGGDRCNALLRDIERAQSQLTY